MRSLLVHCAATLLLFGGCRLMSDTETAKGRSPLQPARPSPSSVTMEIIWARFPAGDPALNDDAWREIDETSIEPSVRRELADNGFRAGVISGRLPDSIIRALNHSANETDELPPDAAERSMQITTDPIVHGSVTRMPRNFRHEISASDVTASLPLLISNAGELSGKTYQQAQAIYALRVIPLADGTTNIELTPEVHCGTPRLKFTGGDNGVLRSAPTRDRTVFDRLRLNTQLAPGELLVLMSLPDAGSRLGHFFHTVDSANGPQQKLILLRVAEMPPGDTFAGSSR